MFEPSQLNQILSGERRGVIPGLIRSLLWVGEFPYYLAVRWRNSRYDRGRTRQEQVPVPIISVGNLTVGGTGKTPFVAWIARWLRQRNLRVTLLSRGYGAEDGRVNDEALELEQQLPDVPHLQNPQRVEIARIALEELDAQILLLDDGFQHRRLKRDLDIVLIDATEPFGFGHLLPRGKLREPIRGLARADLIAITRADAVSTEQLESIQHTVERHSSAPVLQVVTRPEDLLSVQHQRTSSASLAGKRVGAFCGIGNPAGFQHTLRQQDWQLVDFREFPDHHAYRRSDIDDLTQWLQSIDAEAAVCTHKDLVKIQLAQLGRVPLFAQTIALDFLEGRGRLENELQQLTESIEASPCH